VPSRMVSASASVNLPLHHKVQKFSSGTGSPEWSQKKGHKTVVVCGGYQIQVATLLPKHKHKLVKNKNSRRNYTPGDVL